jgi:hypothetical protein
LRDGEIRAKLATSEATKKKPIELMSRRRAAEFVSPVIVGRRVGSGIHFQYWGCERQLTANDLGEIERAVSAIAVKGERYPEQLMGTTGLSSYVKGLVDCAVR